MSWTPAHELAFLLALLVLALPVLAAPSCTRADGAPRELVDGTTAKRPSVQLEGVHVPAVLTLVHVVTAVRAGPPDRARSCFRQGWSDSPRGVAVHRIGGLGESVTFRNGSRDGVYSCDDSPGPREGNRPWCGHAFGRLTGDLLRDPRLELGGCSTDDGRPVAFAWLAPGRGARFVAVHHPDFAEVYRVAAGLPVRVATTSGIDMLSSSATLELSEHAADGRRLRAYVLEARVAG